MSDPELAAFKRAPVSNGNPDEQALIRAWWHLRENARGRLVWEYYLEGRYVDAIWFPEDRETGAEADGKDARSLYPIEGKEIVLCEAKLRLTPELIGQALVYSVFALWARARVRGTVVFAASGGPAMRKAASELGLAVVIGMKSPEPPSGPLRLTGFAG